MKSRIANVLNHTRLRSRRFPGGKTALLTLAILATASLSGALLGLRAGAAGRSAAPAAEPPTNTNVEPVAPRTVRPQQAGQVEARLVTLTPRGFEPEEMLADTRFILIVDDLTGLGDLQVELLRQTGGDKLHEVRLPRGRRNYTKELELPPGEYVLTEANHPNWQCTISVAPR